MPVDVGFVQETEQMGSREEGIVEMQLRRAEGVDFFSMWIQFSGPHDLFRALQSLLHL